MSERGGDRNRRRKRERAHVNGGPVPREGLSLMGDEGREVAINVARIALGKLRVSDIDDPRYRLARDGALQLQLDAPSFEAVEKILKR